MGESSDATGEESTLCEVDSWKDAEGKGWWEDTAADNSWQDNQDTGAADSWQDNRDHRQGEDWYGGSSGSRPARDSWKRPREEPADEPPSKRRWSNESWREGNGNSSWQSWSNSSWHQ